MDQETPETFVEEAAPEAEVVGDSDKKEEVAPEPPAPKKRAPRPPPVVVTPIAVDHTFWNEMLVTKRELDREATRSRYAHLVNF